jgi:hypothetical protein
LFRLPWLGRLGYLERVPRLYPEGGPVGIGLKRGSMVNTAELIEEVLVTRPDEFVKSPASRIYSRPLLARRLDSRPTLKRLRSRKRRPTGREAPSICCSSSSEINALSSGIASGPRSSLIESCAFSGVSAHYSPESSRFRFKRIS